MISAPTPLPGPARTGPGTIDRMDSSPVTPPSDRERGDASVHLVRELSRPAPRLRPPSVRRTGEGLA